MMEGKLHAVEVKTTAAALIKDDKSADKFVKVMNALRPDVAILSFERYCHATEDKQAVRDAFSVVRTSIEKRLVSGIRLEVLLATDESDYDVFPSDLGWFGHRMHRH